MVHLGTSPGSRKAVDIGRTASALLVYQDDTRARSVSLHRSAELVRTPEARRQWFMPAWRAFWPHGPDDDDFVVIHYAPHTGGVGGPAVHHSVAVRGAVWRRRH